LKNLIKESDFIMHLAGEVRPDSLSTDFENSNTLLTKNIIEVLEKQGKTIPILLVSSIHAKVQKNDYGKTKRKAEILVEEYSKKSGSNCFIYRLPHVFGEGCKANYNSVISTWIYNSINNLEINVFDRSIKMHYVYVQDIIAEFITTIEQKNIGELYIEPKNIYETTLGEVIDFINEFKKNINNSKYSIFESKFKQKLFNTYNEYYRQDLIDAK